MILDRIVAQKRIEVAASKLAVTQEKLQEECRKMLGQNDESPTFSSNIRKKGTVSLIAEIKKASPSKGLIRPDFNPREIAEIYTDAGASAISVLTDKEFFQGDPEYLKQAREVSALPLLRKEFVIDEYQVFEAKLLGAKAILLIMAILTDTQVSRFCDVAAGLGLECLVEIHTAEELERALNLGINIIGINNRDLHTFKTDLNTTFRLREMIQVSNVVIVSESGINTRADVLRLQENGIDAMLVGEALMREKDITGKIYQLLGKEPAQGV
ncbi:MAG: indole-3-glycerol phosphate synthase TrpC [Thermincola sp.]|nr:indole-3-glycerol phosphate synthase TrpC [Thermincola sp.]MDT3703747.1 indole-3-glycerol phosphate synthase TrpC [Thermincola sp.]